eukprot:TRINITY_DN2106_c0_g1_i1.p1 TRINITY_DN2106_c0_g1~~TRINITY_DN2106_c0_g1_i1.p1  ORF type:complete len:346 (+),score=34.89 TRINITY_DN2106_c0_g1_i1:83-1039(+)
MTPKSLELIKCVVLLIFGYIAFGFLSPFGKKSLMSISAFTLQAYRNWLSVPLLFVYAAVVDRKDFWKSFNMETILRCGLVGILSIVGCQQLYLVALSYATAVQAAALFLLALVWTGLYMMIFKGEPVSVLKIIGSILCIAGAILFAGIADFSVESSDELIGCGIVVVCTILYSVYLVKTKDIIKDTPVASMTFWVFATGSFFSLGCLYDYEQFNVTTYSLDLWISLFLTSIVGTAIPYCTINYAITHVSPFLSGIFFPLELVTVMVLAYFVLDEIPGLEEAIGTVCVLLGLVLVTIQDYRESKKSTKMEDDSSLCMYK